MLHDETRGPKRFIVLGVPDCKTVNSLVNSFSSSPSASRDRPPVRPVHVSFAGLGYQQRNFFSSGYSCMLLEPVPGDPHSYYRDHEMERKAIQSAHGSARERSTVRLRVLETAPSEPATASFQHRLRKTAAPASQFPISAKKLLRTVFASLPARRLLRYCWIRTLLLRTHPPSLWRVFLSSRLSSH